MLKLNYTEIGLYLERVVGSPEMLLAQRVVLAMRLGQPLSVEPSRASFLLPADILELEQLESALQQVDNSPVTLTSVNQEFVEVGLLGSWVAENQNAHVGMFLTVMSNPIERSIYRLWQISEARVSALT